MITYNDAKDLMMVFEVRMLVRIKGSGVGPGEKAYGSKNPNGHIYLSKTGELGTWNLGRVFKTNAVEGVDFERL